MTTTADQPRGRTADTMLLDVLTHAGASLDDFTDRVHAWSEPCLSMLTERTPDTMLLAVLAHAGMAQAVVGVGPVGRRAQARWLDVEL